MAVTTRPTANHDVTSPKVVMTANPIEGELGYNAAVPIACSLSNFGIENFSVARQLTIYFRTWQLQNVVQASKRSTRGDV